MTVRAARVEECEVLSAICLRSKAHWGYDAEFLRRSAHSLTVTPELIASGRVLVADKDGRPVGVAAVMPMSAEGEYDLERLFVDPSAFGCGAGTALFRAICELARTEGAQKLVILADPNATGFYERVDAVRVGEAPSDSIPGRMLPLYEFAL
jgi:predicted N-acetyltransferase YhbS